MNPVMNIDEIKFDDVEDNGLYTSSRGQISDHIGARKLGYNLTVLPPGKVQCPFHSPVGLRWRTKSSTPARQPCAIWHCRHLLMSRLASTQTGAGRAGGPVV
jgi:hypothetical protein